MEKSTLIIRNSISARYGVDTSDSSFFLRDYDAHEMLDKAIFWSRDYTSIFGKTLKDSNDSSKRLSIVKISYNGKSIYRQYIAHPKMEKAYIGLSPRSIRMLGNIGHNDSLKISVKKGCAICFYWTHPDNATRISVRLGFLSLVLGLLSIIQSILNIIGYCN